MMRHNKMQKKHRGSKLLGAAVAVLAIVGIAKAYRSRR